MVTSITSMGAVMKERLQHLAEIRMRTRRQRQWFAALGALVFCLYLATFATLA